MEWESGGQDSRPGVIQHHDNVETKGVMTTRSRSYSRDRNGSGLASKRRYRERSQSPSRRVSGTRHSERRHDREASRSHNSRHSQTGHRHRSKGDKESQRGRGRETAKERERTHPLHPNRPNDIRNEESPVPTTHDHWDSKVVISRSASRHSSSHSCIDSTMKQHNYSALSPTPIPPDAHIVRLPPPETEHHYTSHRCHHHSHEHSPTRSTTKRSQTGHHRPRRRSSPKHLQAAAAEPVVLPYGARALSRWDFAAFEPLLAYHLEKHKVVRMADLDEVSVRGHWKAFIAKWNAGELEKSWYEPGMFLRVVRLRALEEARVRAATGVSAPGNTRDGVAGVMTPPTTGTTFATEMMESVVSDMAGYIGVSTAKDENENNIEEDDEDEYAPPMPPAASSTRQPPATSALDPKPGPTIPSLQDLELRRTLQAEVEEDRITTLRLSRLSDRAEQKERLDEIAPRAEAGTRDRQLEKRKLTNQAMREFAGARESGEMAEVADPELLGGGADDYRRMLGNLRQKKTEREVRREEEVRARNAEREERFRGYRTREEETVERLREMARQRFG